jgi:hypothetical protein
MPVVDFFCIVQAGTLNENTRFFYYFREICLGCSPRKSNWNFY